MQNLPIKPIISPEEIFKYIYDSNEQRKRDIRLEECVRQLSLDTSVINYN